MEKVIRPWCGQPSDRGRLKNRTERGQMSGIGGGHMSYIRRIWTRVGVRASRPTSVLARQCSASKLQVRDGRAVQLPAGATVAAPRRQLAPRRVAAWLRPRRHDAAHKSPHKA